MQKFKLCFIYSLFIFISLPAFTQDNQPAIQINSTGQLFLDDYLIEQTENITRRINQVQKNPGGPVLVPDKPWEGNMALLFGSVIFDVSWGTQNVPVRGTRKCTAFKPQNE